MGWLKYLICFLLISIVIISAGCLSKETQPAITENSDLSSKEVLEVKDTGSDPQQTVSDDPEDGVLRNTPRVVPAGFLF